MFGALANPARLQILERLAQGPASVREISQATGLKQPTASQHLAVMLAAGVVLCQPIGSLRVYSLRGPRIPTIMQLVEDFYEVHLDSLRRVLSRHQTEGTVQSGTA
jgi:DNA-binding transcriptional ArsR family regulator